MTYRIGTKRRKGAYWWTTSTSRPRSWHGPWRSRDEAFHQACESIERASIDLFHGRDPTPPTTDLRQAAWIEHKELR
jgi:hypothetical protein